jgi:glycosyltransferase involved in cell wall biosynthesis
MSKLKVLAIASDTHGVGKYRILDPYGYIGDNHADELHVDISFDAPNNDSYFNYDIVIFHSYIHKESHEVTVNRIKWLKNKGIKVIMDIDDHWRVDQRHPLYYQVLKNNISEKKVELLRLVNYITTTTPIFAKTISDILKLKNVHIFPNAVNPNEKQFISEPIKSEKIRFGWIGGSSHLEDISILEQGLSSVSNSHKDKVQYVLCGFDTRGTITKYDENTKQMIQRPIEPLETVWFKYESIFTDKYRTTDAEYKNYLFQFIERPYDDSNKPYIRRWTRDINNYAFNYNYFDISLIPLVDSIFNRNKSQLKIIEAGFHKKAVIASELPPYTLDLVNSYENGTFVNKGNSLLVSSNKNHKQWAQHMKRLIENPNMIKDLGEKLYETVNPKFSLQKVCSDRIQFLKTI